MTDPDEQEPYHVAFVEGRYQVLDGKGGSVLVCGDEANAQQYALLLTEAFRRGFKAGVGSERHG